MISFSEGHSAAISSTGIEKQIVTTYDELKTVEDHNFENLHVAEIVMLDSSGERIDHLGMWKGIIDTATMPSRRHRNHQ